MLHKLKRKDLEKGLSAAILGAAKMLEELHIAHCKDSVERILSIKIGNVNLAQIINNLYKIILPGLKLAIGKLRGFSFIFDWAAVIVGKLIAA